MDDQTVLATNQPQASLVVRQGTQVGTTHPITTGEAILGREEGIDISIRDPEVSRRHARISWQSGSYYVEDLGSTNGTFLNGALVSSPQPLHPGDSIGVGQTMLVFQMQPGAMPTQPAAVPSYSAPSPPPPAAAAPAERKGRSRCLLWGCGCLILLGLLVVAAVAAALIIAPDQIEEILNNILNSLGFQVDIVMLYANPLLA